MFQLLTIASHLVQTDIFVLNSSTKRQTGITFWKAYVTVQMSLLESDKILSIKQKISHLKLLKQEITAERLRQS